VVAEVGLSLVLLVGAGLLLRSFLRVIQADPGFDPKGVLTALVSLPRAGYEEPERIRLFSAQVLEGVNAIPGIRAAGITLPLLGGWQTSFYVEGRPEPEPGHQPSTDITRVSSDYFEAMGVRLLRGRRFDARDHADATPVCIIDETFAESYWPDAEPLGKRIRFSDDDPWLEVVGVVGHVKNYGVDQDSRVETYLPYAQSPIRSFTIVVRSEGDVGALAEGIRRAVRRADPNVPVFEVRGLPDILGEQRASRRIAALLTGVFAALALTLAAVGIFGVISYTVTQRTGEIGIRMALGAARSDVFRLVVGRGMALTGWGIALGLAAALALTRLVSSMLFLVKPTDPPTFGTTCLLLAVTAFVACSVPAWRAMRLAPSVALREE
jgi:predicted permease